MALMLEKTYDALRDAGASEEKARAAAGELAQYENRTNKLEADMVLLKWMVASNLALTLLTLGLVLNLSTRHL